MYLPGRQNIADPLSRHQKLRDMCTNQEYVRFVAVSAMPNALTTREVEEASESDPEWMERSSAINNGHFDNCKAYASVANEMCCIGFWLSVEHA